MNIIENNIQSKKTTAVAPVACVKPSVFTYTDYRAYLAQAFAWLQTNNTAYSETAFLRQAGYGANSRGYFRLILNGKRNLSARTIQGFTRVLKFSEKEKNYFENLVYYNQAKTEKEKNFFIQKLDRYIKGRENKAFELLKSQYNYFANWYMVAIRELVSLDDFQESVPWINSKLRLRLSAKQVQNSIEDLLKLGLLSRDKNGILIQAKEIVNFSDSSLNHTVVNNIHRQMLEQAENALEQDKYEDRSISNITIACNQNSFTSIRAEIKDFREQLIEKYGHDSKNIDSLISVNFQLFYLTERKGSKNV